MGSFSDVNPKITSAANVNETATMKIVGPFKLDTEVTSNEERLVTSDDTVKNVSNMTEKASQAAKDPGL
jgi:hypothetical protein